jgi:hypothetical protein
VPGSCRKRAGGSGRAPNACRVIDRPQEGAYVDVVVDDMDEVCQRRQRTPERTNECGSNLGARAPGGSMGGSVGFHHRVLMVCWMSERGLSCHVLPRQGRTVADAWRCGRLLRIRNDRVTARSENGGLTTTPLRDLAERSGSCNIPRNCRRPGVGVEHDD